MPLVTRLSLVLLVLAMGAGAAMFFRKKPPETTDATRSPDTLVLRKSPAADTPQATIVRATQTDDAAKPPEGIRVRKSIDDRAAGRTVLPPPDLETSFSQPLMPLRPHDDRAKQDALERLPETEATSDANEPRLPLIRVVVDGDSLQSLAARYLGSRDRFMEIYDANRDVLSSPELLEIGTKLKIPAADAPSGDSTTESKMVPINR